MKKIIVTYDGSEPAKRAVEGAKSLQGCYDCDVVLYSIIEDISTGFASHIKTDSDSRYMKESRQKQKEELDKIYTWLQKVADAFPNPDKVVTRVEMGKIGPQIVDHAEKEGCDCIVVGSRDIGPFKKLFKGSVSDYVSANAKCSVFIVRDIEDL
ncbi:MAG: universal stress protein [Gallicola sp.]|nr:universal stress protein [Gallicola sp.]